jgi:solute carrier family 38 (sodium-coupled neutral amino acid transporter), member 11
MLVELASFHPRLKGHGVLTFEDLMMLPFGVVGHRYVLGAMLITAYGAMVAYLLIVKDTLVRSTNDGFMRRVIAMPLTCCHL